MYELEFDNRTELDVLPENYSDFSFGFRRRAKSKSKAELEQNAIDEAVKRGVSRDEAEEQVKKGKWSADDLAKLIDSGTGFIDTLYSKGVITSSEDIEQQASRDLDEGKETKILGLKPLQFGMAVVGLVVLVGVAAIAIKSTGAKAAAAGTAGA